MGHGPERNQHGLVVVNHEYTDASQLYPQPRDRTSPPTPPAGQQVARSLSRRTSPPATVVIRRLEGAKIGT